MKSSYRLLSIHLDRAPLPASMPMLLDLSKLDHVQDISEEYNLFDLELFQRRASGCELLACREQQAIMRMVDRVPWCERIYITLDYTSKALVARTLYLRRVLQIMRTLQERFPEVAFFLAADSDQMEEHQRAMESFYMNRG